MSLATKPVTDSLKVTVTGMLGAFVGLLAVEASVTVGRTLSKVRANWAAAWLPRPLTWSVATLAATSAATLPCPLGTREKE